MLKQNRHDQKPDGKIRSPIPVVDSFGSTQDPENRFLLDLCSLLAKLNFINNDVTFQRQSIVLLLNICQFTTYFCNFPSPKSSHSLRTLHIYSFSFCKSFQYLGTLCTFGIFFLINLLTVSGQYIFYNISFCKSSRNLGIPHSCHFFICKSSQSLGTQRISAIFFL